jgi:ABC-2 type transport system ATP-binding protein
MVVAQNLTKRYGAKTALDNVSFSIEKGELVGLLGLNGAGKTTIMNIIAGYLNPTSGSVEIGGFDIVRNPKEAKRLIGYLPELPAFYGDMRVNEYLNFICGLRNIRDNRKAHIGEICERVGIGHVSGRMIRNLSKGYAQRLGFAQALIGAPGVLILDEPTVGLDPSQVSEIRSLIKSYAKSCTVIISSHILYEIQEMCDRIIVLFDGRIAEDRSFDPTELSEAGRNWLEDAFLDLIRRQGGGDHFTAGVGKAK